MGEIVKYNITNIGDLKIEEEYDYEFQYLHLSHLAGCFFDGDLSLYLDKTAIKFTDISVFDTLLGIHDAILSCLANPLDDKEETVLILDLGPQLNIRLENYQLKLKYSHLCGGCDFKLLYREVYNSINEIMGKMYTTRPDLAIYEVDHGPEFDHMRYNWILDNKMSIPEPLRAKVLRSIGRSN